MLLALVAVNLRGLDPTLGELVVEQHAGARATLTVHAKPGPDEVLDPGQPQRVAGRNDKALVPVREPHHRRVVAGQQALDIRERVLARRGVQQV